MRFRLAWIATFISVLSLGFRILAKAQSTTSGEVYGGVIDRDSRQPLQDAMVRLLNLRNGSARPGLTDSRGNYVFALTERASYSIRADKMGYLGQEYPRIVVPLNHPKLVIPVFALSKIGTTTSGQTDLTPHVQARPAVFSLTSAAQIPAGSAAPAGAGLTSLVSLRDWALRSNFDSSIVPALPLRGNRA